MRTFLALLMFVVVILGIDAVEHSYAQAPDIPKDATAALQQFLDVDCEIGNEGGDALNQLLKHRTVLEPKLIMVLRDGPDKKALENATRSLQEQWSRREAFLRTRPELGLKAEDLRISQSITKETYVNQGLEQFIRKYREKAAVGLAAIGSPEGIKILGEVGDQADEGLRAVIRSALERFQRK